jgi:hypothetical protein
MLKELTLSWLALSWVSTVNSSQCPDVARLSSILSICTTAESCVAESSTNSSTQLSGYPYVSNSQAPYVSHTEIWDFKPRCKAGQSSDEDYCVFTSLDLSNQRGMSLLTTRSEASKFLELPAFNSNGIRQDSNQERYPESFEIQEVPGHGIGVVANKSIARGEVIMSHSPVVMINDDIYGRFDEQEQIKIKNIAVNQLPPRTKSLVMGLAGEFGGDPVADIIDTNSFQIGMFPNQFGFGSWFTVVVPELSVSVFP